jgi:hypothetical protein
VAKTEAKPIRFSEGQNAILKRVAAACGVGEADIARWAVDALGDYFEHHGNRLLLPLRFHETFSVVTLPTPKRNVTMTEFLQPGERPISETGRPSRSLKKAQAKVSR